MAVGDVMLSEIREQPQAALVKRAPSVIRDLRLLVTGGIAPEDVRPWLDAGALAVGLGSSLGTAANDGADEVERRCRAALAAAS